MEHIIISIYIADMTAMNRNTGVIVLVHVKHVMLYVMVAVEKVQRVATHVCIYLMKTYVFLNVLISIMQMMYIAKAAMKNVMVVHGKVQRIVMLVLLVITIT